MDFNLDVIFVRKFFRYFLKNINKKIRILAKLDIFYAYYQVFEYDNIYNI